MPDEKLVDLKGTLQGVENELMKRALDRRDATIDDALDVINKAAEDGDIEIGGCEGCDDGEGESETQGGEGEESGDSDVSTDDEE